MKTLSQICKESIVNGFPDKNSTHSYLDIYEMILEPYRRTAKAMLEIGIFGGASLLMWEKYFSGAVHGADCDTQPNGGLADLRPLIASGKHNIHIMDATNNLQVHEHFHDTMFDVIIEDAGHHPDQQVQLYNVFKSHLSPGGIYIIEDIEDLDRDRKRFETLDPDKNIQIIDRRHIKKRFDDVLVIITDK